MFNISSGVQCQVASHPAAGGNAYNICGEFLVLRREGQQQLRQRIALQNTSGFAPPLVIASLSPPICTAREQVACVCQDWRQLAQDVPTLAPGVVD